MFTPGNPTRSSQQKVVTKRSRLANASPEQIVDSLMSAIDQLEIDPIISRKAYRMRLDNIIESDEYNPDKDRVGRPNGRCTNDVWINHIPQHCIPTCLMMIDDIFKMLENDTETKHLRSRIVDLFINLRSYNIEPDHFKKIRYYILQTLDSYGIIDLMIKVSNFES